MQAFDYSAIDAAGKTRRGTIAAEGQKEARKTLMVRELYATEIKVAAGGGERNGEWLSYIFRQKQRIKPKDLALVTRQMATMIAAASPVEEVLAALVQQAEKAEIRGVLTRVRAHVMAGMRLSGAMAQESDTFDPLYCAMVAAGEAAGSLGAVLGRVAENREKTEEMRSKVQSALIYPAVLMTVAIGVVTALMILVVPKVVAQFESFGSELPLLTQIVVATSGFLTSYGLVLAVLLLLVGFGFVVLMRYPSAQYFVHANLLRLPIVGRLIRSVNAARFARSFGTLVLGGSPALEALAAAKVTVKNVVIEKQVAAAVVQVREGTGVASSLRGVSGLPPMLAYMAAAGERSGQLGDMMHKAADYLESEFDGFTKTALSLLEPMIVIFMGAVVGVIVLSIMLPILRLNSLVLM